MADYITVDGGTTNTRLNLIVSDTIVDTLKLSVGARIGLDKKSEYKSLIKKGIEELLSVNELKDEALEAIICSGMITSEGGLIELPHIPAPAGIDELSEAIFRMHITEISDAPFIFIPGVKHSGNELLENDMMRGEETELYGLCDMPLSNTLYVLPGSHSKLIETDEKGRITSFSTSLSGEMISALSEGTILKGSLNITDSAINDAYLKLGCEYAIKHGISSALFKVRILDKALAGSADEVYSFFLGAILSSDYNSILDLPESTVVIGGRTALRNAFCSLLRDCGKEIMAVDDRIAENATAIGALRIYKKYLEGTTDGKAL